MFRISITMYLYRYTDKLNGINVYLNKIKNNSTFYLDNFQHSLKETDNINTFTYYYNYYNTYCLHNIKH